MLRSIPDPKIKAKASMTPIAAAKSKAEEIEGSLFLFPILPDIFPYAYQHRKLAWEFYNEACFLST